MRKSFRLPKRKGLVLYGVVSLGTYALVAVSM